MFCATLFVSRFQPRPHRLAARTWPSQGQNTGSIPVGATHSKRLITKCDRFLVTNGHVWAWFGHIFGHNQSVSEKLVLTRVFLATMPEGASRRQDGQSHRPRSRAALRA